LLQVEYPASVARAREVGDLDCQDPFALAAARVVELRGAEVLEHSPGVLDLDDIERVHDMRVATRRLRAAMEIFAPCFPRKRHGAALKEVKAIADALGERRDRDVAIEALEAFAGAVAPVDRAGVRVLADRLRAEQQRANEQLRPFVTAERLEELERGLAELATGARATVVEKMRA
jgi:CHAD domain-containing protein